MLIFAQVKLTEPEGREPTRSLGRRAYCICAWGKECKSLF